MPTDKPPTAPEGAGQSEGLSDERSEPRASGDKLTRKTIKLGNKQLRVTTLGVGVAVVGVVVAVVLAVLSNSSGGGTATGGACGQVGRDNIVCIVEQKLQAANEQDPNDDEFKARTQGISQGPPSSSGPWAYVVFNTIDSRGIDIGLKVRAGPEQFDPQVGSASRRSIVWAECVTTSTFDPEPDTGIGPTWVKIYWPSNTPTTQYFQSSPKDSFRAYVYAGYALPFTHNGNIPRC